MSASAARRLLPAAVRHARLPLFFFTSIERQSWRSLKLTPRGPGSRRDMSANIMFPQQPVCSPEQASGRARRSRPVRNSPLRGPLYQRLVERHTRSLHVFAYLLVFRGCYYGFVSQWGQHALFVPVWWLTLPRNSCPGAPLSFLLLVSCCFLFVFLAAVVRVSSSSLAGASCKAAMAVVVVVVVAVAVTASIKQATANLVVYATRPEPSQLAYRVMLRASTMV